MVGGMHDGCAWQGACMMGGICTMHTLPWQILRLWYTVNERAVHILLECILVNHAFTSDFYTMRSSQIIGTDTFDIQF